MTTALTVRAGRKQNAILRPVPWRRMAWVTWRQHRAALTGTAVLFVVLTVGFWIAGLRLHHAYSAATACRPPGSFACGDLMNTFNGMYGFLTNGLILQAVPALIGAFVGAPVLAREMETGVFRFSWTQGFGRWRWTIAKLVALAAVVTAAAGAITVLFSWYYQPYFSAVNQASLAPKGGLIGASPFAPGLFDLRGVTFATWTLAAFSIGVLAGILIRRVVPAMVATLAVYAGLAVVVIGFLRQHYLTPLISHSRNLPASSLVVSQQWMKGGHAVSQTVIDEVLNRGGSKVFGKGGIPQSSDTTQYLAQHGFTLLTRYQPATRFWPFQWIEGGWLLALSVLLIAVSVWLVSRRAT